MFKQVVSFVAIVALVVAEEVLERKVPPGAFIDRQATNVGDPALWKEDFKYSAADGTSREESLAFKQVDDKLVPEMKGSYSYLDDGGRVIMLKYRADENGFQAEGDHIPQPVEQIPLLKEEKLPEVHVPFPERERLPAITSTTTTTTLRPSLSTSRPLGKRVKYL